MLKEILDIIDRSSSNDRKDYNGWVCVVNYILFIRKCVVA